MSSTLTVSGMSGGLPSGMKTIGPVSMVGVKVVGGITDASLISGDNTFSVPAGAVAVVIFPGTTPAATIKVRTNLNASDAGLPISPYTALGWAAWPLPSGTTSVILNSSGSVAGVELSFI